MESTRATEANILETRGLEERRMFDSGQECLALNERMNSRRKAEEAERSRSASRIAKRFPLLRTQQLHLLLLHNVTTHRTQYSQQGGFLLHGDFELIQGLD